MSKYDVFISYRRDGGEQSAKAIYDKLSDLGYRVFLDVETLRAGAFNTKLYAVIEECSDVLVILSPDSLDRCDSPQDWVRLEIAHALRCKKNVIPILLRGFSFPDSLPEEIGQLRFQSGLQASVEFFDAFIKKLTGFLTSRATLPQRVRASLSWKRAIAAVAACVLVAFGLWGASHLLNVNREYPATKAQENEVSRLLYYAQMNLVAADSMFAAMDGAYDACEDYLRDPQEASYGQLIGTLNHTADSLGKMAANAMEMPQDLKQDLADTAIDMGDAEALGGYASIYSSQYADTLGFLAGIMDPQNPMEPAMLSRIVEEERALLDCDVDMLFFGLCDLLRPVKDSALKELREQSLPTMQVISTRVESWTKDEVTIKGKTEQILNRQNLAMSGLSQIVGDSNKAFLSSKEAMKRLLVAQGYTEAEAEQAVNQIVGASGQLAEANNALAEANRELEEKKQELREKIAPKEGDDPYLVWGKALRFLSVDMRDDAIAAFEFYLKQMKDEDDNAAVYVASAIQFVRDIDSTGIDYGVLVAGYEPGKTHDALRIGDVIVAVNGVAVGNYDQYQAQRSKDQTGGEFTVSVLRPAEDSHMALVTLTIPPKQPKIALMDLSED